MKIHRQGPRERGAEGALASPEFRGSEKRTERIYINVSSPGIKILMRALIYMYGMVRRIYVHLRYSCLKENGVKSYI